MTYPTWWELPVSAESYYPYIESTDSIILVYQNVDSELFTSLSGVVVSTQCMCCLHGECTR